MKIPITGTLVLLLAGCASPVKPCEKVEDEKARKVIVDYFRAISENDFEALHNLSTRDYVLFENGHTWNNDSLIRSIQGMPGAVIAYEFEAFDFEADCNGSFVHYRNHGTVTLNDTTQLDITWVESAYVKKVDSLLKLDFLHSSVAQ